MKKNLIALAILAACGAASAQSSVTLYGAADVWFGSVKSKVGGTSTTQTVVNSGGVDESFFGFKGTEDLGGGLKANFVLEQAYNIDTGVQALTNGTPAPGQAFSRQSYVGFSSGYGEVRLGKSFTPYEEISGATTPGFDSALAPTSFVWASTGHNPNPANTVYYATPSYSGLSGAASYSFGENKAPGLKTSQNGSVNAKYAGGPVFVGVAYQVDQQRNLGRAAKFTRVNGSYDFGVAKLLAGYGRVAQGAARTTEWQIGADVPVSNALTLSGGYARSKDNAFLGNTKRTGVGLVAHYALSKRTAAYGGVHASKDNASPANKVNIYAVGVRHTF